MDIKKRGIIFGGCRLFRFLEEVFSGGQLGVFFMVLVFWDIRDFLVFGYVVIF